MEEQLSPTMEELESRAKQAKNRLWSLPDAVEPWRYRYERKKLSNLSYNLNKFTLVVSCLYC